MSEMTKEKIYETDRDLLIKYKEFILKGIRGQKTCDHELRVQ